MISHETKSNTNSQITTETSNEIKILQGISKTIDLLLINRMQNDTHVQNLRNKIVNSARSRNSPRHNKFSTRPGKRSNQIYFEDLTEITATDVITEPSESSRSFIANNIAPLENLNSKIGDINFSTRDCSRFILVAPDSSYTNALNFNEHYLHKMQSNDISNKPLSNNYNLPLLRIDSPIQRVFNGISSNNVIMPYLEKSSTSNDQFTYHNCDFLVSPDVLLKHIGTKRHQNGQNSSDELLYTMGNNRNTKNRDFFLQNLLKVDFAKFNNESYIENPSTNVSFSTKSSSHLTGQDKEINPNVSKIRNGLSPCDKNITVIEDNTVDTSTSDTIMYHGYMITPDFISKIQSDKSSKMLPFNKMQDSKITAPTEKEEVFISIPANDSPKLRKYSPALIIENVPILPPDMLANIKLKNGNDVKKFLSVKSVDDPSWIDYENIILNDDFCKHNEKENVEPEIDSFRQLKIVDMHTDFKDELTVNILEYDQHNSSKKHLMKDNLMRSLKEMDKKIIEMENISLGMEHNFANSKKLMLSVSQGAKNSKDLDKDDFINNMNECPPLVLVDSIASSYYHTETQPEADITQISSNEMTKTKNSQVTENISSKEMKLASFPKLNLNFTDNDFKNDTNQEKITVSRNSSYNSAFAKNRDNHDLNIKRPLSIQRNSARSKNRIERDQTMYIQRKKEARKLAIEALNSIGLPTQTSSEIPLKIINYPTPNEMMLSQLHKNEQHTNVPRHTSTEDNNISLSYKPIRHVSFISKVRLQRPEITRRKKSKKAITYTDQLLALQPQHDKQQIIGKDCGSKNMYLNPNHMDLTPRSVISQDTDINSILTDWSVPDNVKRILNDNSSINGFKYNEDLSQIQSLTSNSVIDWCQVSEMLHQHEK